MKQAPKRGQHVVIRPAAPQTPAEDVIELVDFRSSVELAGVITKVEKHSLGYQVWLE